MPFEAVPTSRIVESKTNPRQTFKPDFIASLARSIEQKGLLEPILVRPKGELYELVAGAQRFRACKLAKLEKIDCRIEQYSDTDVLEIQIIENLQREDVHPYEEGLGFQRLIDATNHTPKSIAERIGHDEDYVLKRLSFLRLIKPAADAFLKDDIHVGHAAALSRLPEAAQQMAFEELLFDEGGGFGTLGNLPRVTTVRPVKMFLRLIEERIMLRLSTANWPKDDATLHPPAGACTTCPKRTGANLALFDDVAKTDNCLDTECFGVKRKLHMARIEAEHEAAGTPLVRLSSNWNTDIKGVLGRSTYEVLDKVKTKDVTKVKGAELAIFAEGPRLGEQVLIRRTKPYTGLPRTKERKVDYWEERAKGLKRRAAIAGRRAVLAAVLEKAEALGKGDVDLNAPGMANVIAGALLRYGHPPELLAALKLPLLKSGKMPGSGVAAELGKIVSAPAGTALAKSIRKVTLALALQESAKEYSSPEADKRLDRTAQLVKVDSKAMMAKIEADLMADFNKRRAAAKAKAKAVPAKKKTAKKGKRK